MKRGKKQCNWWCAACGGQYNWRNPNRVLVIQDSKDPQRGEGVSGHAPPQGACENLVCARKLFGEPADRFSGAK